MSSGGGGSGNQNTQYKYYASAAGLICHGPIDFVKQIIIEGRVAWSGFISRATSSNPAVISVEKYGEVRIFWGTQTQLVPDSILSAAGNDQGHQHPAYTGQAYAVFSDFYCGTERTNFPAVEIVCGRKPVQNIITGAAAELDADNQANPYAVLAELFTNDWFGLGLPESAFNKATWQAAANKALANHELTYISPILTSQATAKAIASDLLLLCDGWIRSDTQSGAMEAGFFTPAEEIVVADLPLIDSKILVDPPQWDQQTWEDVKTRFTVLFTDREKNYKTEPGAAYEDARARINLGYDVPVNLQRPSITRAQQAADHAARYGRRLAQPTATGKLVVRREHATGLRPGQHVRVDIDPEPGGAQLQQVCRLTSISTPQTGAISLSVEIEPSLQPVASASVSQPGPEPETPTTPDVSYARFFEAPYSLASNDNFCIGLLASRPNERATGFNVHYDRDAGGYFPQIAGSLQFALRGRLTAQLNAASADPVSVEILDTVGREILSEDPGDAAARDDQILAVVLKIAGNGQIEADADGKAWIEILSCETFTAAGQNIVSVGAFRSRQGTIARDFPQHAEVWFIRRSNLPILRHADFAVLGTADAYFKLQPYGLDGLRPLEECAQRTFNFALHRDIAPGKDDGITPNTVTDLTAAPGIGMIILTWTNPTNTPIASISIYESTSNVRPDRPSFVAPAPQSMYFRVGLDDGAARNYWLSVLGKNGRVSAYATVSGAAASTSLSKSVQDAFDGLARTMAKSVQETADHAGALLQEQQDRATGDSALDQRAAGLEQRATQLEQGAGTMQQNINTLSQNLQGTQQSLTQTQTVVGDANTGLVKDTTTLKNQVNDANTGLAKTKQIADTVTQVVGDANSGLVKSVNTLSNTVSDPNTGLAKTKQIADTVTQVVGDANSGLVKQTNTLSNTVSDPNTGLAKTKQIADTVTQVVGDANSGLVKQINTLATTINNPNTGLVDKLAAVEQMATVLASANEAYAKTLSNVIAQIGSDQGAVATLADAQIDAATGKVISRWSTQVTAASNGDKVVTGLEMIAQNGENPISAIRMLANILQLRSQINGQDVTPFQVIDGVVYINTALIKNATITSAMIESLAANKIQANSLSAICATIGLLRTADSGARLEIESNQIRVYDNNGTLRVRMGVL